MSESTKVLVLDVDDTLYLERDYVRSGFKAVEQELAKTQNSIGFGEACWRLFLSGVRDEIFNRVLDGEGADQKLVDLLVAAYREHNPDISLSDETRQILDSWSSQIPIVILTGGLASVQQKKIEALGLMQYTSTIIYAGSRGVEFDKPNLYGFQRVEESTGLSGPEILYVADNPAKDFPAVATLNWSSYRILLAGSLYGSTPTPCGIREVRSLRDVELTPL